MSGDMTHFLLPSSRLPTDVTFSVGGAEVAAHRSLLATALPAFDAMFFGPDAGLGAAAEVKVEGVTPDNFRLFLHHAYGRRVEVENLLEFKVMVELATLASRFGPPELEQEVMERMRCLVTNEEEVWRLLEYLEVLEEQSVEGMREEVVARVEGGRVEAKDIPKLLGKVAGVGRTGQAVRRVLARHVASELPSTSQLTALLADLPEHLATALLHVLRLLPQGGQDATVREGGKAREVQEVLRAFLEFARFPETSREEMVQAFMARNDAV